MLTRLFLYRNGNGNGHSNSNGARVRERKRKRKRRGFFLSVVEPDLVTLSTSVPKKVTFCSSYLVSVVSSRQTAPLCFCLCFSPSFHSSFSSFSLLFKTDAKLTETKQRTVFSRRSLSWRAFFLSFITAAYCLPHNARSRGGREKKETKTKPRYQLVTKQTLHRTICLSFQQAFFLPPSSPPKNKTKLQTN